MCYNRVDYGRIDAGTYPETTSSSFRRRTCEVCRTEVENLAFYTGCNSDPRWHRRWYDIPSPTRFAIIFMALEFLVIGAALVILMIQLAVLINLLQNEIKPILNSTNETVNTLRGTVTFLSDNLAEPVIKLNQYMAGFKKLLDLLRPGGK
jgi:hypothetical protein